MKRTLTQEQRTQRAFIRVVVVIAIALILWMNAERIHVAYLAALVLMESATPEEDGPIAERRPDPEVRDVVFGADGRWIEATLFLPEGEGPHPGLVVNHGVAVTGRRDARLVNFADAMARAGFVVLAPEFVNLKEFRVRPSDVGELVASYEYLETRHDVDRDRIGFFGLSYAGGLALLAAADERINDDVAFLFLLGSYYDLEHIVIYMTTGRFLENGEWVYLEPRNMGKWAFLLNSADLIEDASDRETLRLIAQRKYERPEADVSDLSPLLGAEGALVYELLTSNDPERAQALIEGLNPRIRAYLDELSPRRVMNGVRAHLILGHGTDDDMMPYTESVLLARRALPETDVHLALLTSFHHVDLTVGGGGPVGFIRSIPEIWRLYSITYDLLWSGLHGVDPPNT